MLLLWDRIPFFADSPAEWVTARAGAFTNLDLTALDEQASAVNQR